MQYQTFSATTHKEYPIAFLVPKLSEMDMSREYLTPHELDPESVIAYTLHLPAKKTKVAIMREYLDDLMPVLSDIGTKYVMVSDGDYFKTLTGVNKADAYLGYVLPNTYPLDQVGEFYVIFCPNYRQVFYNPIPTRDKIKQAMEALWSHQNGIYHDPGHSIIHFSAYPMTVTDIAVWLQKLLDMDCDLTCDTETFSLKFYEAGLGTIGFAWNKHEGIAFPVDLSENPAAVRKLLIRFFKAYKHKMAYHNISFDATILVYQLFMDNLIDQAGLLDGLEIILGNYDCTKIISYLATNTCAGNTLGLKDLAQEFAGNYAVDEIKDITKIPLPQLLEYNLVDCLSTWHVKEKYWDKMVEDNQLKTYEELFHPALVDIVQMQLSGMPVDMYQVVKTKAELEGYRNDALFSIQGHRFVQEFTHQIKEEWVQFKNTTLKVKRVTYADSVEEFNPNSPPQMQRLLYELIGLPIIERTKTKLPATGADVLEKLFAHTEDPEVHALLRAFLEYAAVDKIYSTFIPALEGAQLAPDGQYYLFGSFNLGGTVSGRLSSSGPNLQNLPVKGAYGKAIKKCFRMKQGLFMGLDFSSLEDRISALTTKDTNKLKVYLDGYDGHCLRAFSYFPEQMTGIVDTVDSINSIKKAYPVLRDDSKVPTFLLTYGGTHIGLVAKTSFDLPQAKVIEARYHELYKESDIWIQKKLDEAAQTGFITAAFGLRVRTPLLHQVVRGNSKTPYEAQAEGRTAGNALGQSWCLLNTRASIEFMRKVRKSKYRLVIKPSAHIHDAQYLMTPDDMDVVLWVNEHLVKAVQWQEHPDIAHDTVKLGGELSVFYPSWAEDAEIPNGANKDQILDIIAEHVQELEAA